MAKHMKQFRYYFSGSDKNYPANLTRQDLADGRAFNSYPSIVQLGVQSLPGTKIYLNETQDPIIIGYTGIYELDINGLAEISKIQIDNQSLQLLEENASSYLIIDIIYEDGGNT